MPETQMLDYPAHLEEYKVLRTHVRLTLREGRQRLETLKAQIYWRTGHLIQLHLEKHPDKKGYGKQVTDRLALELEIERSLLYRILKFANTFPQKVVSRPQLTWTHYRSLLKVENSALRQGLAREAVRQKWSVQELRAALPTAAKTGRSFKPLVEPSRGTAHVYRVAILKDRLGRERKVLDLGFYIYADFASTWSKQFKKDARVLASKDKMKLTAAGSREALFYYSARVERVVDGDTLRVQIDLGLGQWTKQYVRFRGIDTPPLKTQKGKLARDFVAHQLSGVGQIYFKSRFRDQYGRYLSDVWIQDCYLNNLLLEKHLAVRA